MPDSSSDNPYIRTYAKDLAAAAGKGTPEPTPAPEPTKPVVPPTPTVVPPPVPAVSSDADRDAVLKRLRERVEKAPTHTPPALPKEPSPAVPSAPVVPPPPPLPPAPRPPVLAPPPLPPTPTPPAPPPIPLTPKQEPPKPAPGPSPIHTYSSDFSDRIDSDQASAFSVLARESDAQTAPKQVLPAQKRSPKNLLIASGAVLLVVLGIGGAYGAYRYVATHTSVPLIASVPSLVFADERQELTGEGPELLAALAASAQEPLPEGQVRVVYLTVATTTKNGSVVKTPVAGGRLVGALQLSAPDILLRNIGAESTVGVVHAGEETRPFFILSVLSYERTFAGMLQWERSIAADLGVLYPSYPTDEGTSASSTPTVSAPPRFIDEIVANHDVRALKDARGRTILLYGYKDKSLLVIVRDEAAFTELVNRLSATKQQ